MIKYSLALLFFLFSNLAHAQITTTIQWQKVKPGNAGDTISYDLKRKLDWYDFRGKPDENSPAAAITQSGFGYRMSMQNANGRTNVVITVFCYFNKKRSWVKDGQNTNYALIHEQH